MKVKGLTTAVALTVGVMIALPVHAQFSPLVPGERSSLYYRIGGGEPISKPANPGSAVMKIGLGGTARLNYTCGKFDVGVTIQNLMNQFANVGTLIEGAVQAGIAALPLYILQRASPGLYELFQTYQKKAEAEWGIALKTCEEMEAVIRSGGDPYEEWIKLAKGEDWKAVSVSMVDAVQAKATVEQNVGIDGITWIGGVKKGGFAQPAIDVVRDLVQAGYNVTMNQPPAANPNQVYPGAGAGATKLGSTFASPNMAANWAVAVVGDRHIASCDDPACPAKAATPGTGLLVKFEAERVVAEGQLNTLVASASVPQHADIEAASAPGVSLTRELIDALRAMRPTERAIAVSRLSMEVAQARIIDRALLIRNLLNTGGGLPEAQYKPAQADLRERLAELNRSIDDLLFETRVRREVVSTTANQLIESFRSDRLDSTSTDSKGRTDPRPLSHGRVQ